MDRQVRQVCYRCFKPQVVCVCDRIPQIDNRTRILILQHMRERGHPIGTARFATLGLKNVELKIPYPDQEGNLHGQFENLEGAGLLYPSADAINLADLKPRQRPRELIVLDGTWGNAYRLYRENKWLRDIPHYGLTPSTPSNYRIRMEPDDSCVSTIEAIVEALKILEPENSFDELLGAFDSMIDDQVAYITAKNGSARIKKPRTREIRTIPKAIRERFENIVIVYGETIPKGENQRDLVSWTAVRVGDGQTFERFIIPRQDSVLTSDHLRIMGLDDGQMCGAVSAEHFKQTWKSFLKDDDVVVPWNKGTLKALNELIEEKPRQYLFLKAAYGNTIRCKCGDLDQVMERENLTSESNPFAGRASIRMGNAMAVAAHLHQYKKK